MCARRAGRVLRIPALGSQLQPHTGESIQLISDTKESKTRRYECVRRATLLPQLLRSLVSSCLIGILILAEIGIARASNEGTVEARIERITSNLLPPVLVQGEEPPRVKLTDRMRELNVPGLSVAVINDGKIEWARGFGVARIGGRPVNSKTLFQAASISKPVSAMAVMNLLQTGQLALDTDVNQYLKSWKLPANEFTKQRHVTLRGLLTHTSSITVSGFPGYEHGAAVPTILQVLDGQAPANTAPIRVDGLQGQSWRYAGGGYVIATLLLQDVTGDPFAKLMRERVMKPLGMNSSTFEQPLPARLLDGAAMPYRADGAPVPGGPHVYPELAAASLWTTPSDLARFAIGMQEALAGKSNRVLTSTTARAMLVPAVEQQAIGFMVGGTAGHRYFTHSGANEGYRCLLVAYEDGDGAVIMTNGDSGGALLRPLLAAIAREYEWPDYGPAVRQVSAVDPQLFDRHVGAYRFADGMTVTFWREGDRRYAQMWGQAPAELFPSSPREYFIKSVNGRWIFPDGDAPEEVTWALERREQTLKRLHGAEERAALDLTLDTQKRVREQIPASASEKSLREFVAALAAGKPNYERMTPNLKERIRTWLVYRQTALANLGAVQTVAFKGVTPAGEDTYDMRFERGAREFRILLNADGRMHSVQFTP